MKKTRTFLALSLLCASLIGAPAFANDHAHAGGNEKAQIHALLKNIVNDNRGFVKHHKPGYFKSLVKGQTPRATVVTCSDSRVHTHALDRTPDGDLFMVRNIGNQLATAEGSVEYGVRHLNTPVLMVIGHSSCGAVKAVMGGYEGIEPAIKKELDTLSVPGKDAKNDQEVMDSVAANVNRQVEAALAKFAPEVKDSRLAVVGAVYDFRNDYKKGNGKLVVINLNGETDQAKIKQSGLFAGK
ncbi:MAG: carbonic anhydrase [Sulfuricella sp.]|nr:carbonic anhydrase [Sulfuricella sp.]